MRLAQCHESRVGIWISLELLLLKFFPGFGDGSIAKLIHRMDVAHLSTSKLQQFQGVLITRRPAECKGVDLVAQDVEGILKTRAGARGNSKL
jgi:hypothetical protein